jgi:L-threonylcarbamoyladenylate synthase
MRTIVVDPDQPDADELRPAAEVLIAGGLVAFPTETVYGLGALALDPEAAQRIFDAKGRPADDPLIVHVRPHWELDLLFSEVTRQVRELAAAHWPGPLTIVGPKRDTVPDVVTSGRPTVAVRAPSHPVAALLLDLVGLPLAAPSANRFSYVSPTSADHVAADLGDVIDVLVDAGPTPVGIESTIVSVTGGRLTLLRPGTVEVAGVVADDTASSHSAPGRMDVHYSPDTPTRGLAPGAAIPSEDAIGVLIGYADSHAPPPGWSFVSLGERSDTAGVARRLYAALRAADLAHPDLIIVEYTGMPGTGAAVDDRIRRATGSRTS